MQSELNELQRLDFVAKSYFGGPNVELGRWVLTGLTLFFFCLSLMSGSPPHEILLVRVMTAVAVPSVLVSWVDSRYFGYAWAATFLAAAVAALLSRDYSPTTLGWAARISYVCFFVWMAFFSCRRAWQATVVRGERWKKEREQVEKWIVLLGDPVRPEILRFTSESFWTGYFTYRMLNTDFCWVLAKFKKGKEHRIIDCRVLELNAVRPVQDWPGVKVIIDNRPIPKLKIPSDMRPRLLAYVK